MKEQTNKFASYTILIKELKELYVDDISKKSNTVVFTGTEYQLKQRNNEIDSFTTSMTQHKYSPKQAMQVVPDIFLKQGDVLKDSLAFINKLRSKDFILESFAMVIESLTTSLVNAWNNAVNTLNEYKQQCKQSDYAITRDQLFSLTIIRNHLLDMTKQLNNTEVFQNLNEYGEDNTATIMEELHSNIDKLAYSLITVKNYFERCVLNNIGVASSQNNKQDKTSALTNTEESTFQADNDGRPQL